MYVIVERCPSSGDALLGQEMGGVLNIHSVCLDGLIFAPEVGEFGKNRVYCIADNGLQLRGSCYDNGFVLVLFTVLFYNSRRPCGLLNVDSAKE